MVEVRTVAGTVRGRWEDGVAVFRGVPFAAPPVGRHRLAAPAEVARWEGVRDADRFGPPPPQPDAADEGDEWLTVAVWTPDPGHAGLPVVVWISGGAYLHCDTGNPHLDGAAVAAAGTVVVSANYRTGAEGFALVSGAPDNRGLLDQIAALRWVQDNIAAFGGDPHNVSVFGQSAGAGSIAALLVMPSAAGLFRRAMLQSVPSTFFTPALAGDVAAEIGSELGRAPDTDVSPAALVAATRSVTDRMAQYEHRWGPVVHTTTPFSPVVDGEVLTAAPWSALAAGAARGVDVLVGHVRDEFRLIAAPLADIDDAGVDVLLDGLSPTPGAQRYRAAYPTLGPNPLRETVLADWLFRMPTLHFAEAAHAGGARVWLYELGWGFGPQGASHGLDTLLVFGTTDIEGEVTAAGPAAVEEARRLSRVMRDEYIAFAATGDPGWARFDPRDRATRIYDADATVARYPEERSRVLWRDQRFGVLDLVC